MPVVEMTLAEWQAEGGRRFGADTLQWKFQCPVCGNVAAVGDYEQYKEKGATPESAYLECIGRYTNGRSAFREKTGAPCDYAVFGLFRLGTVRVTSPEHPPLIIFGFADV